MREERKDVCCFEHFTSFKRFSPSPGQSWEQCFKLCPSWPNCLSNICGIRKQFIFCFSTAADYWQSPWLALWLHNARDAGDNNFINTSLGAANQKPSRRPIRGLYHRELHVRERHQHRHRVAGGHGQSVVDDDQRGLRAPFTLRTWSCWSSVQLSSLCLWHSRRVT